MQQLLREEIVKYCIGSPRRKFLKYAVRSVKGLRMLESLVRAGICCLTPPRIFSIQHGENRKGIFFSNKTADAQSKDGSKPQDEEEEVASQFVTRLKAYISSFSLQGVGLRYIYPGLFECGTFVLAVLRSPQKVPLPYFFTRHVSEDSRSSLRHRMCPAGELNIYMQTSSWPSCDRLLQAM